MMPATFELQPVLHDSLVCLRPLAEEDFEAVYAAASDPLIWEQHPDPKRYQREAFRERFFIGAIASGGAFAVTTPDGEVVGSTRFYDWNPQRAEVVIGYTFLRRDQWGRGVNTHMKRLMLGHAFRWAQVAWFHVGKANMRSRRAVEKLGARVSHEVLMDVNGVPTPYLHYRIDALT